RYVAANRLQNVKCLPYQPLAGLSGSLSAADLHVVVMGNEFVGTIHPCKIYNVLKVGAPVLYIGPGAGHVPEILAELADEAACGWAKHADIKSVVHHIRRIALLGRRGHVEAFDKAAAKFSKASWLPAFVAVVENGQR